MSKNLLASQRRDKSKQGWKATRDVKQTQLCKQLKQIIIALPLHTKEAFSKHRWPRSCHYPLRIIPPPWFDYSSSALGAAPQARQIIIWPPILACLFVQLRARCTIRLQGVHGNKSPAHINGPAKRREASTTPFEPPRRRPCACPQPGNPLPDTVHHSMSARLEGTQMPYQHVILRQVARKNNIGCGALFFPYAFTEAASSVATSTTAVGGA